MTVGAMWARTVITTRSGEKENDGLNKVSMLVFIKEYINTAPNVVPVEDVIRDTRKET